MENLLKFFLMIILFLTGCASPPRTYHLWAGGRADSYTENQASPLDAVIARSIGGTVTTTSGDPNKLSSIGFGGQLGITEQIEELVTTISIFYLKYKPLSYTFNSSTYGTIRETLNVTGVGLDGTLGYNIGFLRPGIGYKYESRNMKADVSGTSLAAVSTTTSATIFMIGPSLAINIPFSNWMHIVAQGDYRIPISKPASVSSANSILVQLGIRLIEFKVKGSK
jgi:hypothetical protein